MIYSGMVDPDMIPGVSFLEREDQIGFGIVSVTQDIWNSHHPAKRLDRAHLAPDRSGTAISIAFDFQNHVEPRTFDSVDLMAFAVKARQAKRVLIGPEAAGKVFDLICRQDILMIHGFSFLRRVDAGLSDVLQNEKSCSPGPIETTIVFCV